MQNSSSFSGDTFIKSLKPLPIEEFLDYYFYRRVAHRMVPVLARWGASPNLVTTISLFLGLGAAYATYNRHFVAAFFLALIAIFFDCCDGQLARLTGKSSPLGRAMDGTYDMLWVTSLWLAICFSGVMQEWGYPRIFWLMLPASISMVLHCWRFDGVKLNSLEISGAGFSEGDLDVEESIKILKGELRKFNPVTSFIAACLVFQMYFFVRGSEKKKNYLRTDADKKRIQSILDPELARWSWLGEGHHNTLVILGILFLPWTPYVLLAAFWTIALPMNLWWGLCEWRMARAMNQVNQIFSK